MHFQMLSKAMIEVKFEIRTNFDVKRMFSWKAVDIFMIISPSNENIN